jgi:hypothetical protein
LFLVLLKLSRALTLLELPPLSVVGDHQIPDATRRSARFRIVFVVESKIQPAETNAELAAAELGLPPQVRASRQKHSLLCATQRIAKARLQEEKVNTGFSLWFSRFCDQITILLRRAALQ